MIKFNCINCKEEMESPQSLSGQTIKCPNCGNLSVIPELIVKRDPAISNQTVINITQSVQPSHRKWSPGVAAVLSFLFPGLGQIYKGQIINGIVWLVVVVIGYLALIVPGLILHFLCIVGAASGDPTR